MEEVDTTTKKEIKCLPMAIFSDVRINPEHKSIKRVFSQHSDIDQPLRGNFSFTSGIPTVGNSHCRECPPGSQEVGLIPDTLRRECTLSRKRTKLTSKFLIND